MGCDIHFFVERYTDEPQESGPTDTQELRERNISTLLDDKGEPKYPKRWTSIDNWELQEYDDEDSYWDFDSFYGDRNYLIFSILAGVRGRDDFEYKMSDPRGLPEGLSYPVKYMSDIWEMDAHSHSYYYLNELIDRWGEMKKKVEKSKVIEDYVIDILDNLIEDLSSVDEDSSNVRCVFWFDN